MNMYIESPFSLNFFILSLFLVNGPRTLYVNPGCIKCIPGINLSHANNNLLLHFILLNDSIIAFSKGKSVRNGIFIPVKLLDNPVASFFTITHWTF